MASSKSPSSFMRHRTKPSASKADLVWEKIRERRFWNRVDFVFRKFSASMGGSKRWAKPRITCRTNIGKMMWKYVKCVAVVFVTFPFLPLNSYPPEAEWCVQNVAGHVLHKSPAFAEKCFNKVAHLPSVSRLQDASGISNHMQTLDSHQRNCLTNSMLLHAVGLKTNELVSVLPGDCSNFIIVCKLQPDLKWDDVDDMKMTSKLEQT